MKLSDLQGIKVVSEPKITPGYNNNPFNIKVGSDTKQYISQGDASVGSAAADGGNFLKFKDRNTAVTAAQNLLFKSGVYKGLTVDQALKKWSNNAYGGDIVPTLANDSIDSLTPEQQTQVLNAMELKGENDAVPTGVKTVANAGPLSVVSQPNAKPTLPPQPVKSPFQMGLQQPTGKAPALPFQTGLSKIDPTGKQSEALAKSLPSVLPLAGSIAGGAIGGVAGGLVSSPTILGIPAGAAAGAVAGSALGGAAGEAAKEGIQGGKLSAGNIAKTGAEFGALEAIGGPAASLVGKTIEGAGKKIAEAFIPTSAKEAALLQSYKAGSTLMQRMGLSSGGAKEPITAAGTAFEKGLIGSETRIGIKAQKAATNLWNNLISPALKQSKLEVDMPKFFSQVEQKIVQSEPELSRQKDLLNALSALKEDYSGVEKVSLQQLQKFKEGWARFVPEKAYKGQPIAGLMSDVKNTAAGVARSTIYSALGDNVKQAYFDYGNLQSLKELGQKAMAGSKFKGGAGSFIHGLWEMATVPVGTIGGQTIYKVGRGIEYIGPAGIKTLGNLLGVGSANQTPTASSQQPSQQPTVQPILPQSNQ